MANDTLTRRTFLKTASAAVTAAAAARPVQTQTPFHAADVRIVRTPDFVTARFGRELVKLEYAAHVWTGAGVRVTAEPVRGELPVAVTAPGGKLTYLQLRWKGQLGERMYLLGDHWERSYGDLEWRGLVPNRVMPWYFLASDGQSLQGYGVKTQPAAFCFWQADPEGMTLTLDLRNGGVPAALGDRELDACTVVARRGAPDEPLAHAAREFCRLMCPTPKLPPGGLFGSNDWNYAYGRNTAGAILRDADLIASLAPSGGERPYVVIDDGWQDPARFPSMPGLAAAILAKGPRPGLWVRPLRAPQTAQPALLLPAARFGPSAPEMPAFDPTIPEALERILGAVRTPVGWGYQFIKHDFSTVELFGQWGFQMTTGPARPGWSFHDRSRTNAEIVRDLYHAIRQAAGEQTVILGCNTVGHMAAGIFESQRIADDTSGKEWERTRRMGVNGLAQRIAQHRTFSHIDPDIVAITKAVGWRETSQWMDAVARSGTSFFLAPDPEAVTPESKSAMRDALAIAAENSFGYPTNPLESTTPDRWTFGQTSRTYDWCGPEGASAFLE